MVREEKNPSFDDMRKMLAEKFASPEENITVLGVKGHFGKNKFLVKSHMYDKKEGLQQILKIERTRKQKKEEIKMSVIVRSLAFQGKEYVTLKFLRNYRNF